METCYFYYKALRRKCYYRIYATSRYCKYLGEQSKHALIKSRITRIIKIFYLPYLLPMLIKNINPIIIDKYKLPLESPPQPTRFLEVYKGEITLQRDTIKELDRVAAEDPERLRVQ
jgi:hypothetical protein